MLYALGDVLVYGPLRNALGFSRIRVAYTAGEAIGPDIFVFFRSLGINLKQLYGQTESSAYCCMQTDDDVRPDTAGPPAPGVEMKIAEDGEIMYRSPSVFIGYYKNPEATAATRTPDGWVHTGDAGVFTESGHLRVVDRAKRRRPSERRHAVRAEIPGEQAQVLSLLSRKPSPSATGAISPRASSTSISTRSATGRSGAASPTPAIPTSLAGTRSAS